MRKRKLGELSYLVDINSNVKKKHIDHLIYVNPNVKFDDNPDDHDWMNDSHEESNYQTEKSKTGNR